jgi:hypothetical protein
MLQNSRSNQINLNGSSGSDELNPGQPLKDKKLIDFDSDPLSNFPQEGLDDVDDSEAF